MILGNFVLRCVVPPYSRNLETLLWALCPYHCSCWPFLHLPGLLSTEVLQFMLPFAHRRQPRLLPLLSLHTQDQGPGSPFLEEKPHTIFGYHCPTSCDPGNPAKSPKSQASPASQQPQLSGPCNGLEKYNFIIGGLSGFELALGLGKDRGRQALSAVVLGFPCLSYQERAE